MLILLPLFKLHCHIDVELGISFWHYNYTAYPGYVINHSVLIELFRMPFFKGCKSCFVSQIMKMGDKLQGLQEEKHQLFLQLKKVLHEEEKRRRKEQR